MGFLDFLIKPKAVITDQSRRENLQRNGRITDGTIIEIEENDSGDEVIYYFYQIQGVDFESSEILTDEKKLDSIKYAPGAKIGVKFDPKNHGNSIII